ncbi:MULTISPECIES: hypothetical protein [Pseudomonas fluorescens group]|uniref:Uncharacterized protein n=1 Tax=Pseudomonas fluorescens TaxID=294 RepID=A0A0D0TGC8_PSEFL|nr:MULTISPECIES: hypothetical protein [Pseudomonas fluorescens group]AZE62384.1 hypothetical protein C4K02_4039 [Pseudomonas synxantha]KIR21104.1 hypothetical protein PFLU3_34890 [Pseudomonas fluorescens]
MPKSASDALDLPKPKLVEAEGATWVDPLKLLEGATVQVYYPDSRSTDTVTLVWASLPNETAPIDSQNGVEDSCVEFHIPPFYVGLRIDNYANFSYVVTRDGEDYPSQPASVKIRLPSNLPAPTFIQAPDGILDLSLLCCDDPDIWVAPWAFIDPIQTSNLYVSGTKTDETRFYEEFFQGENVTEREVQSGWTRSFPLDLLRQLKHGSKLTLIFDVNFGGPGTNTYRLFPSKTLTVLTEPHLELDAPNVVQAVECSPGEFLLNPLNATDGATLRVAYDHACPGDYVCAHWKGTAGPGTPYLTCQEIGTEGYIDFAVPASAISANFKQTVSVSYTVLREGQTWFSPSRDIHILNISDLPKPQIPEATGTTLDLNTFSADPVILVSPWWFIGVVDPRWLWVTGTLEDGTSFCIEVIRGESGPITGVSISLSRCELQKLADCSLIYVHFAVNYNGQVDKASAEEFPVLVLNLVQEDLVLPAPTVREAVGDQLNIWNGRYGVTVRVAYERISANHEIKVCWESSDGSCWPLVSKPGNTDLGYVDFDIPREAVIRGAGKTIAISYTVTSECKQALSQKLALKISVPTRLPTPVVPEATPPATQGGVLALSSFAGHAAIIVESWWFALACHYIWLKCTGTKKDGSVYTFDILRGRKLTAEEVDNGLVEVLSRAELALLKHDSLLTVTCITAPNDSEHGSDAIAFPKLDLILKLPLVCDVERFEALALGTFGVGGNVQTSSLKITFESGLGTAGIVTYGNSEFYSGKHYVLSNGAEYQPQAHLFEFTRALESVRFSWVWKQRPGTVTFYDQAGTVLKSFNYPEDTRAGFWVEYAAAPETAITSMKVFAEDYSFIDNISMCFRGVES